ncbi:MAG: hypothetical protein ACK4E3_10620 [Brevundimonas sp.]|uniref:hypothetical protein n=1 Tax=Brevundimonas sp. TaxID=1871086 RepID=UPI00391951A2
MTHDLDALGQRLRAMGAPGDYGYSTPAGKALLLAHQLLITALSIRPPSQAAIDVLAERQRQIEVEGWTPDHDDEHRDGALANAAAAYAHCASLPDRLRKCVTGIYSISNNGTLRHLWPWASTWWKPTTRRRDLVKACALLLAEIDRMDRACARSAGQEGETND